MWDFIKFTLPYLWTSGKLIRLQTILSIILLILSKIFSVIHPLILKQVIDLISSESGTGDVGSVSSHQTTSIMIGMYVLCRFAADVVNNLREYPFSNVSANAEIYIA